VEGLSALRARQFARLDVHSADETRLLVDNFNRAAASLDEQFRVLETVAQIDQLLLRSADLEHVLDTIMSRVQELDSMPERRDHLARCGCPRVAVAYSSRRAV